ncbi:MAG: sigma-70 family RNA polymerase sigma factor [Sedimentisphaerales bacterium]|nr:sigma-70 family RNA polymerase sigma factor [Sedimentisphaerales bacterium]
MHGNDELILVQTAQAGSVEAFGRLYQRYYAQMVWLAYAILLDKDLAEDAAQEAFAVACSRMADLRRPDRFAAWLGRICKNQAYRILRARSSSVDLAATGRQGLYLDPPEHGQEAVRLAVAGLPVMYRQIIVLFYYNQLSYQQIHHVLGISIDRIKGRLFRARRMLERRLRQLGFD